MKYKVIRRFRDKYTGRIYLPGDTFESNETSRIKNLLTRELIKEVQQDISSLTKNELIKLIEEKGIDFNPKQTKAELIKLLQGGD